VSRTLGLAGNRRLLGIAIAGVVFLWSWTFLDHWFYANGRIVDTAVYQGYGLMVRAHELPYRDFSVDYPPGSLPVFVAPTFVGHPSDLNDYGTWFARLMALCGLACLGSVILARAPRRGVAFVALAPLLVGALMLTRFDLWPTALMALALAAFVRDRYRLGWFALALAISAKLFPVVLVPLAAVRTARRRGVGELSAGLSVWLGTLVSVFLPFAVLAPHGLWESLWGQFSRPIQIESLVGSYLMTFVHPGIIISHDALAIGGHGALAAATTVVEIVCLVGLWITFARRETDDERFLRFAAACVCAFVAFGKVLSPQYLIWLVPLVALVRGLRGAAGMLLLATALVLTQYYFDLPRYDAYIDQYRYAWFVLARNLTLVGLLAVLSAPPARLRLATRLSSRSAVGTAS
jgi:hypothetical protein